MAGHCENQVGGVSTCWMNPVSIGEYHGLRVGSALLSIVAGCIIIGVSRECDADAVGGIFLGAGGLGEYVENFVGTYWPSLERKFLFWNYWKLLDFSPLCKHFKTRLPYSNCYEHCICETVLLEMHFPRTVWWFDLIISWWFLTETAYKIWTGLPYIVCWGLAATQIPTLWCKCI